MKKKSFSDILEDISEAGAARMRRKVPEWSEVPGIEYPTRLSTEQCSSSATAACKAALVRRIRPSCGLLADLTGGLGVDCAAFSRVCSRVLYNEMDPELFAAAQRNFARLGLSNVSFSNVEVTPESLPGLLPDGADIIFLDPARRAEGGRKVFLLEDCSPDILALRDGLLAAAPDVLAKLSPMADISMVCRRLGPSVREVHVVGTDGECKELLVWMHRGWTGGTTIVVPGIPAPTSPALVPGTPAADSQALHATSGHALAAGVPAPNNQASVHGLPTPAGQALRFTAQQEADAKPRLLSRPELLLHPSADSPAEAPASSSPSSAGSPTAPSASPSTSAGHGIPSAAPSPAGLPAESPSIGYLFEPSPVLLKASCFNLLCERFGLYKLGRSTHLYVTDAPSEALASIGKVFKISAIVPFNNSTIKSLGKSLPGCSVTARNLPVSSDVLAARMGVTSPKRQAVPSTNPPHIFAFTADFTNAPSQRLIAITHRI